MTDEPLYYLGIAEAAARIENKTLTSVDLTSAVLDRIDEKDGKIRAFVTLLRNQALSDAEAADKRVQAGTYRGPLDGIPIAIKDLYDTAGVRTTSCSKVRENFVPDQDATTVAKLRAAGAVILGKVATHEFAFGFDAPPAGNPWNTDHTPSGSSGGSGAALAAGFCLGATGSDTGGSIRAPAAACGISGIKPSYGRASKHGVAVLSWSLDHTGPMTRSARDLALMLNVMAGPDPLDPTTIDVPVPDYSAALNGDITGVRVGVPRNYFFEQVNPAVEENVKAAINQLEAQGARLVDVPIGGLENLVENFLSIVQSEAATYHLETFKNDPSAYNDDVRFLLEQGQLILATTYVNALRSRAAIRDSFRKAFTDIDVMVTPGLPVTAPRKDQETYSWPDEEELVFRAHARFNCPFNLSGLPGATVPCGFAPDGLPVGIQIVGKPFEEGMVLRVADAYQQATDWHKRRPSL
jgi:aspartyl-tRNA(Asn)/glutamyl-tRNA(Gln) amidotransferase subunit A